MREFLKFQRIRTVLEENNCQIEKKKYPLWLLADGHENEDRGWEEGIHERAVEG